MFISESSAVIFISESSAVTFILRSKRIVTKRITLKRIELSYSTLITNSASCPISRLEKASSNSASSAPPSPPSFPVRFRTRDDNARRVSEVPDFVRVGIPSGLLRGLATATAH
eukprot:2199700-Pyramimonas_sp.AAC.1